VYGEVIEYLQQQPTEYARRRRDLLDLLAWILPYVPDFAVMERYAELRRRRKRPHGHGLIGNVDTMLAATALEQDLIVVTADGDFARVPDLKYVLLDRRTFQVVSQII
jgi:predicted nucleic acid-binding protein